MDDEEQPESEEKKRVLKKDRLFVSPSELAKFKKLRDAGILTVFREGSCEKCGTGIPKGFPFCSAKCAGLEEKPPPSDDYDFLVE